MECPGASSQLRLLISIVSSRAMPRWKNIGAVCANTRRKPTTCSHNQQLQHRKPALIERQHACNHMHVGLALAVHA
jgi:hypothetical protein